MKKLIYFPFLEPPDQEWLKFALLYFEEFQPIIPYNRRGEVSDEFQLILDETDLINPFSPDYSQGKRASILTIEEAEKLLARPEGRSYFFRKRNLVESWRDPANWTNLLYEEKFSYDFLTFCKDEKIGLKVREGLLLPEELTFMYMTNLAKEISHDREASIITDNIRYDDYTNLSRTLPKNSQRVERFAKGIINLLVPGNLAQIDYGRLIRFRNQHREQIKAFNSELESIQDSIGRGLTQRAFVERFNHIYSDFSKEVIVQGLGVAAIPFAAYILIRNPQAITAEYAKEILGGLGIMFGGSYSLSKLWSGKENKRYCKKYLLNLQRLK